MKTVAIQSSYLAQEPDASITRLLRETPEHEQPLARLERLGPGALSTLELFDFITYHSLNRLTKAEFSAKIREWQTN